MVSEFTGLMSIAMYLAMKLHFTDAKFDFFKAGGKTNAKEATYQGRNDFWFFETLAKKYSAQEIQELLLASFVLSEETQKVWIGDIKSSGLDQYMVWKAQMDSLTYNFEQDCDTMVQCMEQGECTFATLFGATLSESETRIPHSLKLLYKGKVSLHTFLICDQAIDFIPLWDKYLKDPLWEQTSFKIKKYKPFLSIPVDKYRKIMYNKLVDHRRSL
jgi:hypothetical protein